MKIMKGQALISLLFFVIVAVTIGSGAITVIALNSVATDRLSQTTISYNVAEAGIENALLRLLRNPDYTGETLSIGDDSVEISVTGTSSKIIIATSTAGNTTRTIQVQALYENDILSVSSWQELF